MVVVKNIESGRLEIITPTTEVDPGDPRYDSMVHIIPFKEEPDPQRLSFGVHEFVRNCCCHPKIEDRCGGRTIISHSAMVN
jgi:hypothetical protein